jgi:DNA-binding transcriptional LysR family regulator
MDLKKLNILLAVARSGSFTGAADRVNLTQSAVSQQMALLEQEVKEPLFERGRRGVRLTPFALELCERAEPLLLEMKLLDDAFRLRKGQRKTLQVGAFPTAGIELLPKAIRMFKTSMPDVQVMLRNINLESPEISLNTHEVDLILSFDYSSETRVLHPRIRRLDLCEDPFLAIVPASHHLAGRDSIDLEELSGERWIFHRHSTPYRNAYLRICNNAGLDPEVAFYADDFHTPQGLIAEEIGVSIAPQLSLVPRRDGVSILAITPPVVRRVSILSRDETDSREIIEFTSALRGASKSLSFKTI